MKSWRIRKQYPNIYFPNRISLLVVGHGKIEGEKTQYNKLEEEKISGTCCYVFFSPCSSSLFCSSVESSEKFQNTHSLYRMMICFGSMCVNKTFFVLAMLSNCIEFRRAIGILITRSLQSTTAVSSLIGCRSLSRIDGYSWSMSESIGVSKRKSLQPRLSFERI